MPISKILLEVADYCWSNSFLDVFRNFFAKHGEDFEGAPPMQSGEHDLKYYELFQVYLKLYENTLETYLKKLDVPIDEFYRDVRDAQNEVNDPYVQTFVDCLLASADYSSFYKVMAREGAKSLALKKLHNHTSPVKAEAKSESKSGGADNYPVEKKRYTDDDEGEKRSYK